jgi:hypothetical protein
MDNNNLNNKNSKIPEGGDSEATAPADGYYNTTTSTSNSKSSSNNKSIVKANNNDNDLTSFVKLKKLVWIPLTPWENYMYKISSYQKNIEHFQNMMDGLGKIDGSNNGLLQLMIIGGGNFGNILIALT